MINQNADKQRNFRDGRSKVGRLRFLVDFLKASGIAQAQVAEKMDLTRQAVYHWFVRDDMKMSQIYSLFEKFGYSISFRLCSDLAESELSGPSDESSAAFPVSVTMSLLQQEGRANLAFLKVALDRSSISRETLAAMLYVGRATVYNWFKTDDCFLSHIYAAASATGLRLSIDIKPL